MKLTIYSAEHADGLHVDWALIPRVGDSIVLPVDGTERVYQVELVRWLLDEAGRQIGIEVHLGVDGDVGDDVNSTGSLSASLAMAS